MFPRPSFPLNRLLALRGSAAVVLGLLAALSPAATAQVPTRISSDAPIVNFRLPTFTPDGFRTSMVRGSEARLVGANQIQVLGLTMTLFSGDQTEKIETMILSPSATLQPDDQTISGDSTIRVINDEFEASGENWRYDHREKRVLITRNVRVAFRAQLANFLQ